MQQREINLKINAGKFNAMHKRLKYYSIIDRIDKFMEEESYSKRFIVMPGLRGVGKSTILYQLYSYLIENSIESENILYLDVDELLSNYNTSIKEVFDIYLEYFHNTIPVSLDKKIFLLIDEAQYDKNWARFAKILFDKSSNIFMIYTGSSALELESNTDATRRMKIERIYPMNFREYLLLVHGIKIIEKDINKIILNYNGENIQKIQDFEKVLHKELAHLNNDPQIELKKYIQHYAFPFALLEDIEDIHDDINEVIRKIVNDDLLLFKSYKKVSSHTITQIITYLATKKSGKTKPSTIAQSTEISSNTVKEILNTLELTQLIFSINAYGSGGKILKNSNEHFFLTPTIKSSINYKLGRYDINEEKCFSLLIENMVASKLLYLIGNTSDSIGLFYDANKKGVDFIVKYFKEVIPIEVGIGKKTKSQLTRAINKYNAKYGILISNRTNRIKFEDNIMYIPLITFALMF